MQGIIVKNISNDYTVRTNNQDYICKCSGKIKYSKMTPLVGDKVLFNEKDNYIQGYVYVNGISKFGFLLRHGRYEQESIRIA